MLIRHSDPSRYAENVAGLKIRHIEGPGDPYPTTLAHALKMLETWEEVHNSTKQYKTITNDEAGVAFNTEEYDPSMNEQNNNYSGRGRGYGGRGRGQGYGRGGRGGNGRLNPQSQHQNIGSSAETHNIEPDMKGNQLFEDSYNNNNSESVTP